MKQAYDCYQLRRGYRYFPYIERTVAISDTTKERLESRAPGSYMRIYNGANTFGSKIFREDENYIFSADGPEIALYVAGKIDYPIKIVGGSEIMKRKAERWNVDAEFLDGFISDDEMAELYKNCSFYISGDYTDGFGITPLEANHFGKPALVFDMAVHNENMSEGINGFKASNIFEMIEYAKNLSNKSLRKDMAESSYNYAQKFTWDNMAKRYEEEFLSILK